ncbi:mitogen-activated protein kinase kinase kinase 20-like [Nicotiana tabacum]|uniref:Mitogen-activated protein kinase kinase kinase 20-like n=1 Tax=Nicotiana tabacum TaxID=4097 RepID=A0AC58TX08_TOBAC
MEWKKLFVLGAGSYGKVYYTVKIDSFLLCASAAAVKCADLPRSISLHREAHILESLRGCPNVVQYFRVDVSRDVSIENNIPTYNLFLEYACGGSLHDLINLKRGKVSELEIGFYAYQLLKGIQDVHKRGWVHCDIKPANVLVFDANELGMHKLKLADFGLSLRIGVSLSYITGTPLSNRGTLLYAPPESLICGFHAKAYDIWSLGCTVEEMMTGTRVWIYQICIGRLRLN